MDEGRLVWNDKPEVLNAVIPSFCCVAISNELTFVIESSNKNAAHAKGMLELLKKESAEKKKDKATPLSEIRSVLFNYEPEIGAWYG